MPVVREIAGDEVMGRNIDWANVKLKALPVDGIRFSAPLAVAVGTDGVAPFGGVMAEAVNRSDKRVVGGPSGRPPGSGGSSGPLKTMNPGPRRVCRAVRTSSLILSSSSSTVSSSSWDDVVILSAE